MIGFFPDLYPDELLYSACARYLDLTHYRNKALLSEELFGIKRAAAWVLFPHRIEHLITNLPPNHSYTSDQLIDGHTALPFFSPFMNLERAWQAREDMKISQTRLIPNNTGASSGPVPLPMFLRFCPLCADEDRNQFGEYYWHRLHQLPGVEVCPVHEVWLEQSSARARQRSYGSRYVSAEATVIACPPRNITKSVPDHRALINIARDASWLVDQRELLPGGEAILSRYLKLYTKLGISTQSGIVRRGKLKELLLMKYSPELLKFLHCDIKATDDEDWPAKLRTGLRRLKTAHPLQHLLLIQATGCTAEEFFSDCTTPVQSGSDMEIKPFGDPPWQCLNHASNHFGKLVVREYELSYTRDPCRRPKGVFHCECGFSYLRIGADSSLENRSRFYRILSYGRVWETKFQALWNDPSLALSKICNLLGIKRDTKRLKKIAVRLGLAFPRIGPGHIATQATPEFLSKCATEEEEPDKITSNRNKWLAGLKMNSGIRTTKELISNRALARVYRWLLKHDREWLSANQPKVERKEIKALTVRAQRLWEERDMQFAPAIESAVKRIKGRTGRPIKLTKRAICEDAGIPILSITELKNLPRTNEALAASYETQIDLAIRRIRWATDRFKEENIIPSRTKLMDMTIITLKFQKTDEIKEAANQALRELADFAQRV